LNNDIVWYISLNNDIVWYISLNNDIVWYISLNNDIVSYISLNNDIVWEEQTTQWPKEKRQKDKQQSTKHTHKTKDRVARTPLKHGGELMCSIKDYTERSIILQQYVDKRMLNNKGNNKITELRTILQRESPNSNTFAVTNLIHRPEWIICQ
jgi:hypothetical protein